MTPPNIPLIYRAFFLYIEPVSTIVGAYFAWFQPKYYLTLTHQPSAPLLSTPTGTEVVLRQLANLYFAFTLNEALVLRATSDVRVWKTLLFGLLLADFGHCLSCLPLGTGYYYEFWDWNSIAWGNIAFVYCGATLRTCFLLGLGLGTGKRAKTKAGRVSKSVGAEVRRSVGDVSGGSSSPSSPRRKTRKG